MFWTGSEVRWSKLPRARDANSHADRSDSVSWSLSLSLTRCIRYSAGLMILWSTRTKSTFGLIVEGRVIADFCLF